MNSTGSSIPSPIVPVDPVDHVIPAVPAAPAVPAVPVAPVVAPVATAVQIPTVFLALPMPLPHSPGMPHLEDENITEYFDRYESICETHRVSDSERLRRLPEYYERMISIVVKNTPQYARADWKSLVAYLPGA